MEQQYLQIISHVLPLVIGWFGGNVWRILTFKKQQRREELQVAQSLWLEIERLQAKILDMFKTVDDMETHNQELRKENRTLQEENDVWKETADKLRRQLQQVSSECDLLKAEILKFGGFKGNTPESPGYSNT